MKSQFTDKEIQEVLFSKNIMPIDTLEAYKEMLRDCYGHRGMINICGYEYDCADALEVLDPIAFRCNHSDYWSNLIEDETATEVCGELYYTEDYNQAIEDLMESQNLETLLAETFEEDQAESQVSLGIA